MSAPSTKGPGEPIAWMRRWYFDGQAEFKVRSERTGRMRLHPKFMWLPVTPTKIIPDDVPLYAKATTAVEPNSVGTAQGVNQK